MPSLTAEARSGALAATPAAITVSAFGVAFGVIAKDAGFSALSAALMSASTFGGAAQFAAVSVLAGGGSWVAASIAGASLNLRYIALGVTVAPALARLPRALRPVVGQLVVDESWAVAQERGRVSLGRFIGAGLLIYIGWLLGTLLGFIASGAIDPEALGLDAVLPALFLLLLRPHLASRSARGPAVLAAAVTLAAAFVLPAGFSLLVGGAIALGVFARRARRDEVAA